MAFRHQSADKALKPCGFCLSKDSVLKIHVKLAQDEESRDVV